jgi:hypothetical protein
MGLTSCLPIKSASRQGRPWHRYEKPQPGHRLQIDVKFLERIAGSRKRLYQFTAIDDWTGKPLPASHRSPETTRVLSPHRLERSVRLHSRISPARQLVASAKSTIGCSRLRASFRTRIFGAACSPSPGSSMPIPKPHIIGKTCGASQVTDCVKSYIAATSRSAPIQQDESGARSDQL